MGQRTFGNEHRVTMVCIDSYVNGVPVGRFYNPGNEGGEQFNSLSQLICKMDNMLDDMQFPQSFTRKRSFQAGEERLAEDGTPDEQPHSGKVGTFAVRILFRQYASWQGSVTWLEGKQEMAFRSVLELIQLLDSAMPGITAQAQAQAMEENSET